jgi:hypothetical protein
VGERYIDTVEVRSSILLPPTIWWESNPPKNPATAGFFISGTPAEAASRMLLKQKCRTPARDFAECEVLRLRVCLEE